MATRGGDAPGPHRVLEEGRPGRVECPGPGQPSTWSDDDAGELAARRKAAALAAASVKRHPAARAVPVRAQAPGRDFSLEPAGPGWSLYSATRFVNTDADMPDPVGGVCVEVVHDQVTDPETGEIYPRTRYKCCAPWRPEPFRWPLLEASEIDLARLAGIDRQGAGVVARFLLRPLALERRRQQLNAGETNAIHTAWRLATAAAL